MSTFVGFMDLNMFEGSFDAMGYYFLFMFATRATQWLKLISSLNFGEAVSRDFVTRFGVDKSRGCPGCVTVDYSQYTTLRNLYEKFGTLRNLEKSTKS